MFDISIPFYFEFCLRIKSCEQLTSHFIKIYTMYIIISQDSSTFIDLEKSKPSHQTI